PEPDIRTLRKTLGIAPTYYPVDTCAAAFEARASYFYATYEGGSEVQAERRKKVIVLGGGPHRSGQDIAYDFCCCHACRALKDAGVQAIMINANPGAVSTDCGVADRLYCEPLTFEDVMHVVALERPDGIIVQFGGRTSLDLAAPLLRAGAPILGASPDAVDRTEDRERFQALIRKLDLLQPASGAANAHKALQTAGCIADAEALADGSDVYVAGIMEHSAQAGVHSGGSPRVLPPHSLPVAVTDAISRQTVALARELRVVGLMNVRFAIENGRIAILRVNLHASRAVPFVSKATGVPLPRLATQVMLGRTLKELDPWGMRRSGWVSVKDAVVPLRRFPGADLPPDSGMPAGQVMGIGPTFAEALRKSRIAAGHIPPPNDDIAVRSIQEYYAACACS
ncbi:MAG: carbamoyl phosphate synthase large subunit, partial [Deltaproteobacteria bacterium]|nr:carbamoyl phosphate synthase large subunit [Deltaproteobacteria bacterium]